MMKILIVEDDTVCQKVFNKQLQNLGYSVAGVAASSSEAFRIASEHSVDVVLMDIQIKGDLDGIETARILKERYDTGIVFLTGAEDTESLERAIRSDPLGYLLKPPSSKDLRIAIEMAEYHGRTQKMLRENEQRFSSILEMSDRAVILEDPVQGIRYLNNNAQQLLGISANKVLGKQLGEVLRLQDLRDRHDIDFQSECPPNETLDTPVILLGEGGQLFIVRLSHRIISDPNNADARLLFIEDISEQYARDENLKLLASALEDLEDGILIAETGAEPGELQVRYVNESFSKITGFSFDEVISLGADLPTEITHRPRLREIINRALASNEAFHVELRHERKNGELYFAEWNGKPIILHSQKKPFWLISLRDSTRLRRLEENILRSQKLEAVGRLADGLAHDFNNIIAIINGLSELIIRMTEGEDKVNTRARQILEASQRGGRIVGQLLAFSRKKDETNSETIQPQEVIKELIPFFQHLFNRNISFNSDLRAGHARIELTRTKLEQIFLNLCTNARDAISDSGGRVNLTVETSSVNPDMAKTLNPPVEAGEFVVLRFRDNGCGMDEETKLRIFDPYFTTKEMGKGTGLGMSTIYSITKHFKGGILVDSSVGHGTTFEIFFPIARTSSHKRLAPSGTSISHLTPSASRENGNETAKQPAQSPANELKTPPRKSRPRVWLCEPNKILERSVKSTLETRGFEVEVVEQNQAVGNVDKWMQDFDAILVPQEIAKQDDFKAVSRLTENRPQCKMILTHGVMDDQEEIGSLNSRVSFLQSPYSLNRLLRELGV